jgi:hypothetical protein
MIGAETSKEHKQAAERKAPRGLLGILRESSSVRWMTMGASVLALSKAAQLATTEQADANPNTYIRCVPNAQFNPHICDMTKQQAVDGCQSAARVNQLDVKSHGQYAKGSQSKYHIGFIPPNPFDCDRAGKMHVAVEEQLRDGPNGTFGQNGKAFNFTTRGYDNHGHFHHKDVTLDAPYDCATLMPGSVVRPFLKIDFVPTPGWSNTDTYVNTVPGPAQSIC